MKQLISLLIAIILLASCSVRKPFLKKVPEGETASVAIGDAVPSVCFFGPDDAITYTAHKQAMKDVYGYFVPVYDNFPIFDIGTGKIVSYENTSGTYIFYQPYTKGKTGIIISDGESIPVICYSPPEYLDKIKRHLNIETADDIVPKTENERNIAQYRNEMEQAMQSTFRPDKHYADLLIQNANTVHYPLPLPTDTACNCREKYFQLYQDSLLQQTVPISYHYKYNSRGQMTFMESFMNGESQGTTEYVINNLGLIEKMEGWLSGSVQVLKFIYEKDRYYVVTMQDKVPVHYEVFYLNPQKQCVRRNSKRTDGSLVWDIQYSYDTYGRLITERQEDREMLYEYRNTEDKLFSSLSSYTLNPRVLLLRNEAIRNSNTQVLMGRDGNQNQTFRSVTVTNGDCSVKTYSYDATNQLTSVNVSTCQP